MLQTKGLTNNVNESHLRNITAKPIYERNVKVFQIDPNIKAQ